MRDLGNQISYIASDLDVLGSALGVNFVALVYTNQVTGAIIRRIKKLSNKKS